LSWTITAVSFFGPGRYGINCSSVAAGNDINIESTTRTQGSRTNLDRIAGVYASNAGGTLVASAGNDVNLIGAIMANNGAGGTTQVTVVRDINLGTITTSNSLDLTFDAKNYQRTAQSTELGSVVSTHGDTFLNAGRDINARAATRVRQLRT